MLETVSAARARASLGSILDEVSHRGRCFVIERRGRGMAAVVPVEQFAQWWKARDEFLALVDEIRAANKGISPAAIERDIAAAVRAARRRR